MKKFTKAFLTNSLGFNEDEAKIIMKAQRQFPELLVEDTPIKSARKMYIDLGLAEQHWARWSNQNIVENTFFTESKDWKPLAIMGSADKSRAEGNFAKDYTISVDMAKHLCMKADTLKAHEFRKYFILMEKAIKDGIEWEKLRFPQKQGYKEMCKIIDANYLETHPDVKKAPNYVYGNEANMINRSLLGYSAKKLKSILEIEQKDATRDSLQLECNKALLELQILNGSLILNNIDYKARKVMIENTCKSRFVDLKNKFNKVFSKDMAA